MKVEDFNSLFYKNYKQSRKINCKICNECPFRKEIEKQEKYIDKKF